ncbi:antitoxin Xre/MbcA/ParS toxin-binding domain-containing protein [Salinicola sp. RZ23]|uniref:type II RES/Xre toxin-antitoxin system antitoxin n=1 Tax=Salinicola sp. RZ23 TaxID=1949087 RepID=UPI000DA21A83|nr:antitoxin Xre/MbcA/ParS toxin-binding domain-containing protein [Salinicola sp. RZ23]
MTTTEFGSSREPSISERAIRRLTGRRRVAATSPYEIHRLIEQGFASAGVIKFFEEVDLLQDRKIAVKILGVSERTLYRRRDKPDTLSPEESGRAWRFAETLTRAEDVFGSTEAAQRWLDTPAMALEGRKPLDLMTTPVGHDLVDDLLTRLDYGVYT